MGLLHDAGLAAFYLSDIHALNPLLDAMGQRGMPVDQTARLQAAQALHTERTQVLADLRALIPDSLHPTKIYKRQPTDSSLVSPVEVKVSAAYCAYCTARKPNKRHTCWTALAPKTAQKAEITTHWVQRLPWVPSWQAVLKYIKHRGYKPQTKKDRVTGVVRETTEETALRRLALRHEADQVFPALLKYRGINILLGTFLGRPQEDGSVSGGLRVSSDNCVHPEFNHNASTLRILTKNPTMQNIPRGPQVKQMFVAPLGHTFFALDFAGIEAILVGHFAKSPRYMRLASLDIHSFYMAYALYEFDKVVTYGELPQESWSDAQLAECLASFKARFKAKRQANKPLVHGGNYLMGPFEAQDTILKEQHIVVPLKEIKRLQAFYWELFPEIPEWHKRVTGLQWPNELPPGVSEQEAAHQRGYLRTPFGNIHRYYDVLTWVKGPKGWELRMSSDAKRAVAFLPQSSGRMILTRAAQRTEAQYQDLLRLFIHDEVLGISQICDMEQVVQAFRTEMERPVPELGGLVIPVEAKTGACWGAMQ